MINYIKYTIDGKTYSLINNGDGTWYRDEYAPSIAGNYLLTFEICENGISTTVDSSNSLSLYETYLQVVVEAERTVFMEKLIPDFIAEINEFKVIYGIENKSFDILNANIEKIKTDAFITTASNDAITRIETFIGIEAIGSLEQRKSYLKSLLQKRNKINESVIKGIANAITGSDCIITFFGSDELGNPEPGNSLLRVRVLTPDTTKDYRYGDIERALKNLIPAHIKLAVIRYYALWDDIVSNFNDWESVKNVGSWRNIRDFIPPQ